MEKAKKGRGFTLSIKDQEKIGGIIHTQKLSMKELASECGITTKTFSRIVHGENTCHVRHLGFLKSRFNIDIDDYADGSAREPVKTGA